MMQMSDGSVYINGEKYPLPQQVVKNIETVIGMQTQHTNSLPIHVRLLQRVAAIFGTANFLYLQLLFFIIWMGWSNWAGAPELPFGLPRYELKNQMLDT